MSKIAGLVMVVIGIAFGVWAGFWWAFVGGIVDIINAIRATEVSAVMVGVGVIKIFFATLIGWAAASIFLVPGLALIAKK